MRWEQLFDDLEGRFEHEADAEQNAQLAERVRADRARTSLTGRLQRHRGPVRLVLRHGRLVTGELVDAGADWVVVEGDPRGATIVPLPAIVEIDGLGWESAPDTAVAGRLRLGHPLRRLARDREVVEVLDLLGRELVARSMRWVPTPSTSPCIRVSCRADGPISPAGRRSRSAPSCVSPRSAWVRRTHDSPPPRAGRKQVGSRQGWASPRTTRGRPRS